MSEPRVSMMYVCFVNMVLLYCNNNEKAAIVTILFPWHKNKFIFNFPRET